MIMSGMGGLSVEVEIGGQKIDKHYANWMTIYDELFETRYCSSVYLKDAVKGGFTPLRFWFNRNPFTRSCLTFNCFTIS